jgi:ketosteroid isomerase-like protein
MRDRELILFGALTIAVGLAVPSPQILSQEPGLQGSKVYSSPQAVFDAFREARKRGDWKTLFPCMTVEFRDDQTFEAFFSCSMRSSTPEVRALYAKFGVRPAAIQADYHKQYKAKHGIDIPERLSERRKVEPSEEPKQTLNAGTPSASEATAAPAGAPDPWAAVPPTDADILRRVVCAAVKDREGFCAAVERMIGRPPTPIGELGQLKVDGDTAVGHAKTTIYHLGSQPGKGSQKVGQEVNVTFRFRKQNGKWLIESKE